MKVQAKRLADGEHVMFEEIRRMNRIRTDLKQASHRAGWLVTDDQGLLFIFDDEFQIVSIEET